MIRNTAWNLLLAAFVIVLPGWTLLRMISRWRWSLRDVLVWPLFVLLILILLRLPIPEEFERPWGATIGRRCMQALVFAPPIVFIALLIAYARQQRWRQLLGWGVTILIVMVITIVVMTARHTSRLDADERMQFSAWDVPLALAFYNTSWLGCTALGLAASWRSIKRLVTRRRPHHAVARETA